MEKNDLFLTFKFIEENDYESFTQIEIFDNIIQINPNQEYKIEIPISTFKGRKDRIVTKIIMKKNDFKITSFFNIYYGHNFVNCFLGIKEYFKTYEFLFRNFKEINQLFFFDKINFNYDFFGSTKDRRRVLIINSPTEILIGDDIFSLQNLEYLRDNRETNSFQLSIYNLNKKKIVTQPIYLEENIDKKISIELFKNFYNDFKLGNQIKEEEVLQNEIKKYFKEIPYKHFKNIFKNENFNNHLYICIYYLYKKISKYEKNIIKLAIDKLEKYYTILNNDSTIELYQKIITLKSITIALKDKIKNSTNIKETLDNFNLTIYNNEKIKNTPLYNISINFIKELIQQLSGDSLLFYPLLLLDCGVGYYENESIYTFNMLSPEMVIEHLNECLNSFILLTERTDNNTYNAYNFKLTGTIVLNERKIFKTFNKKKEEEDEIINNFLFEKNEDLLYDNSIIVIKNLLHELFGHKKFKLDYYESSPKKFFTINGDLKCFQKAKEIRNNKVVIKKNDLENRNFYILKDPEKGESGKFLEFFFDSTYFGDISNIIDKLKNLRKIIKNINLWIGDLSILKEYITLKKKIQRKNVHINNWEKFSINDEINEMKKELYKNKDIFFLNKKRNIYLTPEKNENSDFTSSISILSSESEQNNDSNDEESNDEIIGYYSLNNSKDKNKNDSDSSSDIIE
jgi:hypothetical protein